MRNRLSSDAIYDILEKEILELTIRPGTALSEAEMCERFSVSRTPMRSVLQRLSDNGLVTTTPYRGSTVTLLDADIIDQIIYQRVAVESMVLRDFMKICSPMLLEKVRYMIRLSELLLQNENHTTSEFNALDQQLHEIWFCETRKTYLLSCMQKTQCHYTRYRMLDLLEDYHLVPILAEHKEILDVLERKDYEAVEPLIRRHLYGGVSRLGERIYTDYKEYFLQK